MYHIVLLQCQHLYGLWHLPTAQKLEKLGKGSPWISPGLTWPHLFPHFSTDTAITDCSDFPIYSYMFHVSSESPCAKMCQDESWPWVYNLLSYYWLHIIVALTCRLHIQPQGRPGSSWTSQSMEDDYTTLRTKAIHIVYILASTICFEIQSVKRDPRWWTRNKCPILDFWHRDSTFWFLLSLWLTFVHDAIMQAAA